VVSAPGAGGQTLLVQEPGPDKHEWENRTLYAYLLDIGPTAGTAA